MELFRGMNTLMHIKAHRIVSGISKLSQILTTLVLREITIFEKHIW